MSKIKTYSNDRFKILHGSVFDCFKKIAKETIDLVFTDPPYNIGKDFDGISDAYDENYYVEWMEKWINEIHRVTKPFGSVYLMNSTQNLPMMDLISRKQFTIQSRIVWAYDSSGVQAKTKFGSCWEPILHMTKDKKQYTFNHESIMVEAKTGAKRGLIDYRKTPPQPYNTRKVPSNVWQYPRVRFRMDEYENHPTQKPVALMERIVLASSNADDLVLDPFSGSFATGVACKLHQRRFVGFELNKEYVKIGIRRLGISSNYDEQSLAKIKTRKTKNKSKKDHLSEKLFQSK